MALRSERERALYGMTTDQLDRMIEGLDGIWYDDGWTEDRVQQENIRGILDRSDKSPQLGDDLDRALGLTTDCEEQRLRDRRIVEIAERSGKAASSAALATWIAGLIAALSLAVSIIALVVSLRNCSG